jgi:hypothetical protein
MATKIGLYVTPRGNIIPATNEDAALLRTVSRGTTLVATLHKPRNLAHHRKYRALLAFLARHHPRLTNPDAVADVLKIRAGFCDVYAMPDGTAVVKPRSTSFDDCSQADFDKFYRACLEDLFVFFFPDVPEHNREEFREEALRFSE